MIEFSKIEEIRNRERKGEVGRSRTGRKKIQLVAAGRMAKDINPRFPR